MPDPWRWQPHRSLQRARDRRLRVACDPRARPGGQAKGQPGDVGGGHGWIDGCPGVAAGRQASRRAGGGRGVVPSRGGPLACSPTTPTRPSWRPQPASQPPARRSLAPGQGAVRGWLCRLPTRAGRAMPMPLLSPGPDERANRTSSAAPRRHRLTRQLGPAGRRCSSPRSAPPAPHERDSRAGRARLQVRTCSAVSLAAPARTRGRIWPHAGGCCCS